MFIHNGSECFSDSCTFLVDGGLGHIHKVIDSPLNFFFFVFVGHLVIDLKQFGFMPVKLFKADAIGIT